MSSQEIISMLPRGSWRPAIFLRIWLSAKPPKGICTSGKGLVSHLGLCCEDWGQGEDAHRNLQQSGLRQRTELDFFRPVLYRLGEWMRDHSLLRPHQATCLKSPSKKQSWDLQEARLDSNWMIESPGWAVDSLFSPGLRLLQWLNWGRSIRCWLCCKLAGWLMAEAQSEPGIRTLGQAYLIEQVFSKNYLCFWGCYTSYGLSQHPPLLRKQTLSSKLSFLQAYGISARFRLMGSKLMWFIVMAFTSCALLIQRLLFYFVFRSQI